MSRDGETAGARRELVVILLLAAAFVAYFLTLCVQKWRAYGYGDFDLAIFDQAVWGTSRGHGLFPSSIRFGSVFADHVPLILLGVVPLYWALDWFVPGALILLALQAVAVGSAAVPLHLLARRLVGSFAGVAVGAAYLLHPATGYLVLFEFHPGALAVPFLCWMLWALHAERWRSFLVFAALALACREDVALPVAVTGAYALWREWRAGRPVRRWESLRWGVVPAVAAVAWFLVAVLVIVPGAQPGDDVIHVSPFVQLFAYHAEPGIHSAPLGLRVAEALLAHPVEAVQRAAAFKPVGEYTWHLLAPTGGLAVLSPWALLPALPTWFLNVTSIKTETSSICYQYTANLLPFLFLATVSSMTWLGRLRVLRERPWLLPAVLVVSALASSVAWGKQAHPHTDPLDAVHRPHAPHQLYATDYVRDDADEARDALLALVPDDASLVTTFAFLGKASMRETLHSWHYVRTGHDPVTGAPVTTPRTDFVLLDSSDVATFEVFGGLGSGARQRAYLEGYRVVARAGPAVLMAWNAGNAPVASLAEATDEADEEVWTMAAAPSALVCMRPEIEVLAGSRMPAGAGRELAIELSWSASQSLLERAARGTNGFREHGSLWARFTFSRDDGVERRSLFALSHGLHPISEWTGVDADEPRAPFTSVTASYRVPLPPGRWRGRLDVCSTAVPGAEPLASFDLGAVDVP